MKLCLAFIEITGLLVYQLNDFLIIEEMAMRNVVVDPSSRFVTGALAGLIGLAFTSGWADSARAQGVCPGLPDTAIYALTTDNTLYTLQPGSNRLIRLARVTGIDGNLIGIDFRPADNSGLYGVTDTGTIYLINLAATPPAARVVSSLTARFAGGYQSLMDFNPVVNALRLIGSNDQNYAVVNANGGNLNQTVPQTALQYVAADPNAGVDPNITAGAYDNNVVGATQTTFYLLDYDRDTFVTIADRIANGSSNTGGGKLRTIGPLVDPNGNPINIAPAAGFDIYTDYNGTTVGVAVNGQTLYCVDFSSFDLSQPVGTLQKVVAAPVPSTLVPIVPAGPTGGGFIDLAISPFAAVISSADLTVSAVGPLRLIAGKQAVYTITVTNRGPAPAPGVTLTGGANVPLSSAFSNQGNCTTDTTFPYLSCQFDTLASGASVTATVVAETAITDPAPLEPIIIDPSPQPPQPVIRPPVQVSFITASFSVTSAVNDPNPVNNSATVTTVVNR